MTIRQFINMYNVERSAIKSVTVVVGSDSFTISGRALAEAEYAGGALKVCSFTITPAAIIIYAR